MRRINPSDANDLLTLPLGLSDEDCVRLAEAWTDEDVLYDNEAVDRRVRKSYHMPGDALLWLVMFDSLSRGCGVEGWSSWDGVEGVSYSNAGSIYAGTLFLGPDNGIYFGCLSDAMDTWPLDDA